MVQCVDFGCPKFQWQKPSLTWCVDKERAILYLDSESVETISHGCFALTEVITQGKSDFTTVDNA